MRVLAIDYGTVRVGLALSDPLKMFASPYKMIPWSNELAQEIALIVEKEDVDTVVLGMPYRVYTVASPTLAKVQEFAAQLRALLDCPLVEWDESFTSRRAQQMMIESDVGKKKRRTKGTTDQWAAALILQEYLDSLA